MRWESDGQGEYTIETVDKAARGTDVILHLREGEDEFLSGCRLRAIIRKYSDHITLPILMKKEEWDKDKNEHVLTDEDETVNQATALWARPKTEITDEQYQEFYKHVAHDFEAPLAYTPRAVEGTQEYTQLLYIPAHAPFDLWDRDHRHGVKLYVRRVFIMDDAEQLMPAYLRFVRGVIDSNDLPLNVSREILQQSQGRRGDPRRLREARAGPARGPGRERQGQVRHVLEGVRPRAQGRRRRGLTPTASASRSCCASPRRTPTATSRPCRWPTTWRA